MAIFHLMFQVTGPVYTARCARWVLSAQLTQRAQSTLRGATPASLAHPSAPSWAFDQDIPTVPLAYDLHATATPVGLPPLLMLHGLFGSKANARSISRQLAKRTSRDVYCLDLRNHGDSPHTDRHDYPSMAADVERFINDHGLARPVVVGHSMGAKAAMALVLRSQSLCSGLIAVDNAPVEGAGTGFHKFGKYIRALQTIEARKLTSLKECDALLAAVEPSLPIRQFLLTNMRPTPGGAYASRVPLATLARHLDNVATWPYAAGQVRWTGDSLFLRGTQSPYVADEYIPTIGLFFPRFRMEDVDCGHWVLSEAPSASVDAITRFVEP